MKSMCGIINSGCIREIRQGVINAPATTQPYHNLHWKKVTAIHLMDDTVIMVFMKEPYGYSTAFKADVMKYIATGINI